MSGTKKYFCGHCKRFVSKTLFFKHKKLYYDHKTKQWKLERLVKIPSESDFEMSAEASDLRQNEPDDIQVGHSEKVFIVASIFSYNFCR